MGIETMTRKVSQSRQYESGTPGDFAVMTRKVSESKQYEVGRSGSDGDGDNSKN